MLGSQPKSAETKENLHFHHQHFRVHANHSCTALTWRERKINCQVPYRKNSSSRKMGNREER